MPKPLSEFYQFPVYQTREQYDAQPGENAAAPPWDSSRVVQPWVDPKPVYSMDFIGVGKLAIYEAAVQMASNGTYATDEAGQPKISRMAIPFAHATVPNFLPPKGIVPTMAELGGGDAARRMLENAGRQQSIPLNLPEGARVRWAPGIGGIPVVYLAGEPLPEEQGAAGQSGALERIESLLKRIAAKVGV